MPKTSTRKERRQEAKVNYLSGKAKKSYTHRSSLNSSLEEDAGQPRVSTAGGAVCAKCSPILGHYADTFKGLVHQGSKLKRRKQVNPHPKHPDMVHYHNLKSQNDWIRENLFDPMGNYLFCCSCIQASLGISRQRLARQRAIKRRQSQEPLRTMTKLAVEEERLSHYVVMPASLEISFKEWWSSLQPSDEVTVRYPHARHGNAGRKSNSSKVSVMEDFLSFIDANSQSNGRSADSSGPTHYFLPKFTTLQMPAKNCPHYEERLARSLIGEFNRAQRETGRGECSNGSCHNWLKLHRPKHSISPHKDDYCDTCSEKNTEIRGKQTTLNRLQQAAASLPRDLERLEEEIKALKQSLENHRREAKKSRVLHRYSQKMSLKMEEDCRIRKRVRVEYK